MNIRIQVFFICIILISFFVIVNFLRKKKLNLKYTILWLFSIFILLIATIFPNITYFFVRLVGIETPINGALVLASIFLVAILIGITSIVSYLNNRVRVLTQEIALLKKDIDKCKEDGEKIIEN